MGRACSLAEGAKLVPFPASGRSRDLEGGEAGQQSPSGSPPTIASRSWVGEWPCACGQHYRVLVEPLTFWPRNSATGFRAEPDAPSPTALTVETREESGGISRRGVSRFTRARNTTLRSNEELSYPASLLSEHPRGGSACVLSQFRVGLLMQVRNQPASLFAFVRA